MLIPDVPWLRGRVDLRDHGLRRVNALVFAGRDPMRIGRPGTISGARVSRRRAAR
jgi:hypothetical protein